MKTVLMISCGLGLFCFVIVHFLLGKQEKVCVQEHTGVVRREVRLMFPFWSGSLLNQVVHEERVDTVYSRYLRERLERFEGLGKRGRWIVLCRYVGGVLYPDKALSVSVDRSAGFPIYPYQDDRLYGFFVDLTARGELSPQYLSEHIGGDDPAGRRKLELEYIEWLKVNGSERQRGSGR